MSEPDLPKYVPQGEDRWRDALDLMARLHRQANLLRDPETPGRLGAVENEALKVEALAMIIRLLGGLYR